MAGAAVLVPGSVLFFDSLPDNFYSIGVALNVVASVFLILGATADMCGFLRKPLIPKLISSFMLLGGYLFLIGSILFLPACELSNAGTWVFRFGSCSYLCGSLLSLYDLYNPNHSLMNAKAINEEEAMESVLKEEITDIQIVRRAWTACFIFYAFSSSLFIVGGILSQFSVPGLAVCWVIGSLCTNIASTISIIERYTGWSSILE
uniref:YrhK domain-containing protein n=1 Tax=Vannella robusta TaxID=1487602 RepID=A0A7S4HR85_9EUKA